VTRGSGTDHRHHGGPNLQSLLPREPRHTKTSGASPPSIPFSLVLANDRIQCDIYPTEHGSDHRAIHTSFAIQTPEKVWVPRLLFKSAPWGRIRTAVAVGLAQIEGPVNDLDAYTERFVAVVTRAIERHTPQRRPSSYAKRW
jgi:hypothetical protein